MDELSENIQIAFHIGDTVRIRRDHKQGIISGWNFNAARHCVLYVVVGDMFVIAGLPEEELLLIDSAA